jgi:tetratricopeptide (TPR) repeat protein
MKTITAQLATRITDIRYCIGWMVLLTLVALVYWPGLKGPFLFDDFGTLAALGNLGGVNDWITFKAYVLGGFTGPTGRPLSLLSFLIDGNNWPTDAWPFKRTNLIIHTINGVLLGVVTAKILRLVGTEKTHSMWLALVCAALWLLHPFLVSTTLYAVQRMAQLSTLFILAGIGLYLYGRSRLGEEPVKAYVTMSAALGVCTLLAMISKENGILLPLLVLVIEFTIFASQEQRVPSLNRYWFAVFLVAPCLIIVSYLGLRVWNANFFEISLSRNFSMYERLLTESRILVDYLGHWFLPKLYTAGVFQDHFAKSTGLLSPKSTPLSMLFHAILISVCVIQRRKWPLFAFGILFFYGSHLLESTLLNLELYFEHRNYLAAAFLFLPLIVLIHNRASHSAFVIAVLCIVFVLAGFTRYTTSIWESYPKIVETAAKKVPTSARAQQQHALILYNSMQYNESLDLLNAAIERIPDDHKLDVMRSTILCNLGLLSDDEFNQMRQKVVVSNFDGRAMSLYTNFISAVIQEKCPAVALNSLRNLFTDMLEVPQNGDPHSLTYSYIMYLVGLVDIKMQEPRRAVQSFEESLKARPGASQAMQMASLMATDNFFAEAMYLSGIALAELEAEQAGALDPSQVKLSDVVAFRETIQREMDSDANNGAPATESED